MEEEESQSELGEGKNKFANDEKSEEWNKKHDKRYSEIMGDSNDEEELLQVAEDRLGESEGTLTKEPFDAVHIAKSGDIEDHDEHFVMTDGLRHQELKAAVLMESESTDEKKSQKLAKKMEYEQAQIEKFQEKQQQKDDADTETLAVHQQVEAGLTRHHLTLDADGRPVPDFE